MPLKLNQWAYTYRGYCVFITFLSNEMLLIAELILKADLDSTIFAYDHRTQLFVACVMKKHVTFIIKF